MAARETSRRAALDLHYAGWWFEPVVNQIVPAISPAVTESLLCMGPTISVVIRNPPSSVMIPENREKVQNG